MPPKYLFVDWSGDLGFAFGRGSSTHMAIVFATVVDYHAFQQAVMALRARRGLPAVYEYHYAHLSESERDPYFTMLQDVDFSAWVLLVNKRRLAWSFRQRNQHDLMGELTRALAWQISSEVAVNSILLIDDRFAVTKLTQTIRAAVSSALRARRVQGGIRKARGCPAHQEDGLQLADMLAGAVIAAVTKKGTPRSTGWEAKVKVTWFEADCVEA